MYGRRFVNQAIYVSHKDRKIGMRMQRLRLQGCLETGHQERRPDPLAGNISNRDSPSSTQHGEKIIIVPANTLRRFIESFAGYSGDRTFLLGKESLLNVLCILQ